MAIQNKTRVTGVCLPEEIWAELDKQSEEWGHSRSRTIHRIIREWLKLRQQLVEDSHITDPDFISLAV